jgi:ABC-2 type transport system permease protein
MISSLIWSEKAMQKILKVAQREYIETTRTKTFIFMILMLPVMIVAIIFFANRLSRGRSADRPSLRVAVADRSGQLSEQIDTAVKEHNTSNPKRQVRLQELQIREDAGTAEEQGKAKLRRGELDVYVVLDKDVLGKSGKMRLYTHKAKPPVMEALWTIESPLRDAVFKERCKQENLSPGLVKSLRNSPIERMEIGSTGGQERVQSKGDEIVKMLVPFFFMYLLFLGIVTMGQQMLSSIIEEKNSRVIEVLLAAVSPFELMAGKILGLVGVGFTVVALWGGAAYGAARWQGLNIDVGPEILPYFIVYYILGFFLFGSVMVGIGSICNTVKETQSLMTPVILLCVLPLIAWQNIIRDSSGTLARTLSFFPPTTPMVMILRLSAGADIWIVEIIASLVLLAAAVLGSTWVAAKVFRTGILMYGKRPGLREVARWLRQT